MAFSDVLIQIFSDIFKNKVILKQESDFVARLEHELMNGCFPPSNVTTEYGYDFVHGNPKKDQAKTDIVVWDNYDCTKIYAALEVKYQLDDGVDIHGNKIINNGSAIDSFDEDLQKIKHLVSSNISEEAYAIYITNREDWLNDAKEKADEESCLYKEPSIVTTSDGYKNIKLYLLIVYAIHF